MDDSMKFLASYATAVLGISAAAKIAENAIVERHLLKKYYLEMYNRHELLEEPTFFNVRRLQREYGLPKLPF